MPILFKIFIIILIAIMLYGIGGGIFSIIDNSSPLIRDKPICKSIISLDTKSEQNSKAEYSSALSFSYGYYISNNNTFYRVMVESGSYKGQKSYIVQDLDIHKTEVVFSDKESPKLIVNKLILITKHTKKIIDINDETKYILILPLNSIKREIKVIL